LDFFLGVVGQNLVFCFYFKIEIDRPFTYVDYLSLDFAIKCFIELFYPGFYFFIFNLLTLKDLFFSFYFELIFSFNCLSVILIRLLIIFRLER